MNTHKSWPLILFLTAFAVCAIVFVDVLPAYSVLQAPDAMPSFAPSSLLRRMLPWMNGTQATLTHDDLLKVLPTLWYHEVSFMVASALLALAMGVYLRTLGLPLVACFGGGLAMAFSGYHFTLFNAGHRGYFIMMPYAVFLFALVERAIRKPRWFYFALMPVCVVCGLATQPDVLLIILLFLAVYSLMRLVQVVIETGVKPYFANRWRHLLLGMVVLAVTGLAIGYKTVEHVLTVTLAGREQQIAQATGSPRPETGGQDAADTPDAEKEARWIFATNWSLPPEALAEFIAPCLRGLDTNNPRGPYWGRLGRTPGWEDTKQGFHNFRQHTLYLGTIQIAVALFAIIAVIIPGRRQHSAVDNDTPPSVPGHNPLTVVTAFWATACVVAILLALGRHTPVYSLFYNLPHLDKIRAPVKFVHVAEIAISVLFAIGLARLLGSTEPADENRLRRAGKITMITLGVAALACIITSLAFDSDGAAAIWTAMGIPVGSAHDTLAALFKGALLRAAWMFALVAAALSLSLLPNAAIRAWAALPCVLLLIGAAVFDMAEIGRRYVVAQDVSHKFQPNPIARTLEQQGPIDGLAYSYIQLTNQLLPGHVPFLDSLSMSGLAAMDPVSTDTAGSFRIKAFTALQNQPVKRWKFWGAAAVLTDPQTAREMIRSNLVKVMGLYNLDERFRLISPKNVQSAQVAVVEPLNRIPSVAVYHGWRTAPVEDALTPVAEDDFDLTREIVVSGGDLASREPDRPCTPATWVKSPLETRGSLAKISVETEQDGLLMIREHRLRGVPASATVNGRPAPLYTANGLYHCVPVEAGKSTVVIRPTLSASAIAGALAAVAFTLFAILALVKSEFRREAS